jgi:hypothetical protein
MQTICAIARINRPGVVVAACAAMRVRSVFRCWLLLVAAVMSRRAAADNVTIAIGVAEATSGIAAAGQLDVRLGRATVTARVDTRQTLLVGIDATVVRDQGETGWDAACVDTLRVEAATTRCWTHAVHHDSRITIARTFGAAAGVRRDGDRYDVVAALRLYPIARAMIEAAVTGPIAGRDEMFVHHARFAPGWYLRGQWGLSVLRVGGELGMTGLASRSDGGSPRADTYGLVTLAVVVGL